MSSDCVGFTLLVSGANLKAAEFTCRLPEPALDWGARYSSEVYPELVPFLEVGRYYPEIPAVDLGVQAIRFLTKHELEIRAALGEPGVESQILWFHNKLVSGFADLSLTQEQLATVVSFNLEIAVTTSRESSS